MKALLVVDLLNDFLDPKGALFCGEKTRGTIPFVKKKINQFHRSHNPVIFLCDEHKENAPEFKLFAKHCLKGSWGSNIIAELEIGHGDVIIKKNRYSGFFGTNLGDILKQKNIKKVEVCGVCTSICVMDTVGDLRNRNIPVIVWREGVADFDAKAHKFALGRMEKIYGAKIK